MPDARGRPFQRGAPSPNPAGRPPGARNRSTLAAEALLQGEAESLARKAVELGLNGDMTALRICLDRILPRSRERPLSFRLPPLKSAEDSVKALAAIAEGVSAAEITSGEASPLVKLVEVFVRAIEVYDLDVRVKLLEAESSNLKDALRGDMRKASRDDKAIETSH